MVHALGAAADGIWKDGGQAGGLVAADGAGRDAVVVAAGGIGAIDASGAPLDYVEIELEDAALAEYNLSDGDEGGFRAFAKEGAAGAKEQILDELLVNGGGSAEAVSLPVFIDCKLDLLPVKTVVLVETGVLGGDNGMLQIGRDLGERYEVVAGAVGLAARQ